MDSSKIVSRTAPQPTSGRLAAIVAALDATAAAASEARSPVGSLRLAWPGLVIAAVVLAALVYANSGIGLSEETIGAIYLHPYRMLALDESTPRRSECGDGFFTQGEKPVFGVCVGGHRLPLLHKTYIAAWPYWPLWWIGKHCSGYVPILINVIPALVAAMLLSLLAIQLARHDGPLSACLGVASLLLFPFAVLYASVYLYETLPITAVFGVWWLLDRYNRTGRTGSICLAVLLAGFACDQKLVSVFLLGPFLVAYACVFGLRRLSFRQAGLVALAGCFFPVIELAILGAYAWTQGGLAALPTNQHAASLGSILLALPGWALSTLLPPASSVELAVRTAASALLFGQCLRKPYLHFRGKRQPPAEVVAALTLAGTLCGFALLYRYNPSSVPVLSLLPFSTVVVASLWLDAARWLEPRLGLRAARGLVVAGFSVIALPVMAVRWSNALEESVNDFGYPRFSDQTYVTSWLLDHDIRTPLIPTGAEMGVLEFLSAGRIQPLYIGEEQCHRITPAEWEKPFAITRDRQADFLVPTPHFTRQPMARQCHAGIAEDLAALLSASDRRFTKTDISPPGHSWDFTLFSVSPAAHGN